MRKVFSKIRFRKKERPKFSDAKYLAFLYQAGGKKTFYFCKTLKDVREIVALALRDEVVEIHSMQTKFKESLVRLK